MHFETVIQLEGRIDVRRVRHSRKKLHKRAVMLQFGRQLASSWSIFTSQIYVNVKTTVATTHLGVLWWILDPILLMLIYYFVVKMVFGRGGEDYHLFALCGILTWQTFSRSFTLATNSLVGNANLVRQCASPLELFVFIPPVVQAFFYVIGLTIIFLWSGADPGCHLLWLFGILPLMILLPFALGLIFSIFQVYFRDTSKLITYLMRFGFYLSPVLYSPERVYQLPSMPEWALTLYGLNPMVYLIPWLRQIFLADTGIQGSVFLITGICVLGATQFGLLFFRRFSGDVAKRL